MNKWLRTLLRTVAAYAGSILTALLFTEAALFEARQVEVLKADVKLLERSVADEAAAMGPLQQEREHIELELAELQHEKATMSMELMAMQEARA